jgi:hypothetical protein
MSKEPSYPGMKPGATLADEEIVRWMWQQWPLNKGYSPKPKDQGRYPRYYKPYFTPEMKEAADRLLDNDPSCTIDAYSVGAEMRRCNPCLAEEIEQGFLSSIIAGAKIPETITSDMFVIPKHVVIFRALVKLEGLGFIDLRNQGIYAKMKLLITFLNEFKMLDRAGGENYIRQIERSIGIPSAIDGFTLSLLKLAVGRVKWAA